ncbi:hypothetical protein WG904_12445 [Pedobacter sp. Du54]|uniref:hypothetical protein n=1 Tax=Pedobacter anseongensis TaxID=3133439 RepID=UPI00309F71DF
MKTKFKQWTFAVVGLFAFAFVLQTTNVFSAQKRFVEQAPVEGCKSTDVSGDMCIKPTGNIKGCANTIDSASFNCNITTPPPVE